FFEADRLDLLDDAILARYAGRTQGRKGGGLFREMVQSRMPNISEARSLLEAIVLDLVRTGSIPAPDVNRMTDAYRPDFRWRDSRVLVETDGYEFHRGFEKDAERSNQFR